MFVCCCFFLGGMVFFFFFFFCFFFLFFLFWDVLFFFFFFFFLVFGFLRFLFIEMYVNVVLVKLFVQRNELQFSSVQYGSMVSTRSEKPISTPPRLSAVSPMLPLK